MEELKIRICSRSEAFCGRVEHNLALWREAYCVCCAAERTDWDALQRHADTIFFLDLADAPADIYTAPNVATVAAASDDAQAIESYRHHPTTFLRADFSYAEFCEAMGRCWPFWRNFLQWLELSFHREQVRLPLCQLRCAKAEGRETLFYCTGGVMRASISLRNTAELLPSPPFLRCQKSFLVHIGAIRELSGGNAVMTDGQTIPMTRGRARELTDAVLSWNAARGREVGVK